MFINMFRIKCSMDVRKKYFTYCYESGVAANTKFAVFFCSNYFLLAKIYVQLINGHISSDFISLFVRTSKK